MTQLIKIAGWTKRTRANVVFVHGLGGDAYSTWRHGADDGAFWPTWLARDIPGLTVWTLAYQAPPTNWLGTAMPLQDHAKNVLECILGEHGLDGPPLIFVCHSLGGLVVKQLLRVADGRRAYSPEAEAILTAMKGVVFLATPHTGSMQATLLDKLRLFAWPSDSTLDLVKNNGNLRDLNVWYRNWSGAIQHKVFYENQSTAAGMIVLPDSSDPGLLHVDPIRINRDHVKICKLPDDRDLVHIRTRDFIAEVISRTDRSAKTCGMLQEFDRPVLPAVRPNSLVPVALRLVTLAAVGTIGFSGIQALVFPRDALAAATVEQIEKVLRAKSPQLTPTQIDRFVQSLREARGDPSFQHAVEEAQKGNTRIAEGIWLQIYENRKNEQRKVRAEQAEAARNLAAIAVVDNMAKGLALYREATVLDPDGMAAWLGLGEFRRGSRDVGGSRSSISAVYFACSQYQTGPRGLGRAGQPWRRAEGPGKPHRGTQGPRGCIRDQKPSCRGRCD